MGKLPIGPMDSGELLRGEIDLTHYFPARIVEILSADGLG